MMLRYASRSWMVLVLHLLAAAPVMSGQLPRSVLDGYYERWLLGVEHLMHQDEREMFLSLSDDVDRELFIHRFWQLRDDDPETPGNPALERWQRAFEEANFRFAWLDEDRARAMLIAGKPAQIVHLRRCRGTLRPLKVWTYTAWHAREQSGREGVDGFTLVFFQEGGLNGRFRHWSRRMGLAALTYGAPAAADGSLDELMDHLSRNDCYRFERPAVDLEQVLATALDRAQLHQRLVPVPPPPIWLAEFRRELDAGALSLPARTLEVRFPGRYQGKTVVHVRLEVPIDVVSRNARGQLYDRLQVIGDVKLGERLIDAFRIVHYVAGEADRATVPLELFRRLRPGTYVLRLRLEDASGLGLLREDWTLEVPRLEHEAEPPAGYRKGFAGLTRPEVGMLTTLPAVELRISDAEPLVGRVEAEAVTTGGPIDRVDFRLDEGRAVTDREPPYMALLDFGAVPRRHRVEAVAFDPAGRELARDAVALGDGQRRRFMVRLAEPEPRGPAERARAVVEVPTGEELERVDFYLGDALVGTVREPPFVQPLPARRGTGTLFVRAVATLRSGLSMEDLVIVDSPHPVEEIDVELVELYTSVFDDERRFVTGLGITDFRVREDDREQEVVRFDTVESLAINVALLMDVSGSMRRGRLEVASRSAQRFFATVLTPKDRASLLSFNHEIRRVVPFTADAERLKWGATGFRAWGTTRLHDSLVWALHGFGGLDGKRALVLLSDGRDVDSDFQFEQVLESALRSGVAVYPILLDIVDEETRGQLERLAAETGGSCFAIVTVGELDRVYRRLEEELRSQYLLVYRPPARKGRGLRRVEVEVLRPGLRARTLHGYYP